jgi:hypothetical protein
MCPVSNVILYTAFTSAKILFQTQEQLQYLKLFIYFIYLFIFFASCLLLIREHILHLWGNSKIRGGYVTSRHPTLNYLNYTLFRA